MRRPLGLAAGCLLVLTACSSTVTGAGVAGPGSRTPVPTATTSSATPTPTPTPPTPTPSVAVTAVGNPRTVDMCKLVRTAPFARYGSVEAAAPSTPVECDFYIRPPGASDLVGMSVYITGARPFSTTSPTRISSGITVYQSPFAANDCRASIAARGVAISVDSFDRTRKLTASVLCAMRNQLVDQVTAAIASGAVPHTTYAAGTLTSRDICPQVDPRVLASVKYLTDVNTDPGAFGNECYVGNTYYDVYVYVGIKSAPVVPGSGGKVLTVGGHRLVQLYSTSSTRTLCRLISQQIAIPVSTRTETIEASAELTASAPADAVSGAALCTRVVAPLLVSYLTKAGLK